MIESNGLTLKHSELSARYVGPTQDNTAELQSEHERLNHGIVRTRFPPEPNGYLHVGHAKSMYMNFRLAFDKLGVPEASRRTVFRYDDTNPEAESHEYVQSLYEDLTWMGWTPEKVTYTSQHFDALYDMAVSLIRKGKAYVCHQSKDEIEADRLAAQARSRARAEEAEGKAVDWGAVPSVACPYRDRPVEENLRLFEDMRKGKFGENEAVLRFKQDWDSDNPNLWDQVAYRVRFSAHPNAGDKWCVYPTYDATHCVIDSLEHIDYSICTLEFEPRRESYYWLLDALGLYRPKVYEMSRLNIEYTQLSKRKLLKLVNSGFVKGWDDPRMPTIRGLRRRGYTARVLNAFCAEVGAGRNENVIEYDKLAHVARQQLDDEAPRCMGVYEPVRLDLEGLEAERAIEVPDFPTDAARGAHRVTLSASIFVDRADVHLEDPGAEVYCITRGRPFALKGVEEALEVLDIQTDSAGKPRSVRARVVPLAAGQKRPKGNITWCPADARPVELRIYGHLFTKPTLEVDDDWERCLNDASLVVHADALVDPSALRGGPTAGRHVQMERKGYFVVDQDSTDEKLVLNLTVGLFQSVAVAALKGANGANRSRKAQQEEQARLKEQRRRVPAEEMYKEPHVALFTEDRFSQWDAQGLPTHDAAGEKLAKSKAKKLAKEMKKQQRLYEQSKE